MSRTTYTRAEYESMKRQMKRGWAKYFEATEQGLDYAEVILRQVANAIPRINGELQRPAQLPPHITSEFFEMAEALNKKYTCPVCLDLCTRETAHMTWCGHILCKGCYETLKERDPKPKCPICRASAA